VINNSYVLGLFGGTYDSSSALTNAALGQAAKKQPTPPWSTSVAPPKADAMVRAALGGRRFINEDAAQLDVKSASADYRKLFALYQGLDTLTALTNRAGTKGVSSLEMAQLNKRFTAGLSEIGTWLSSADFDGVRMAQGVAASISKTGAGVPRDSAVVGRPAPIQCRGRLTPSAPPSRATWPSTSRSGPRSRPRPSPSTSLTWARRRGR